MGSVENTENTTAASSSTEKKQSRTIIIRNFPTSVGKDEIDQLLAKFGTVKKCKQVSVKVTVKVGGGGSEEDSIGAAGEGSQNVEKEENRMETYMNVTYETPEMAQLAMEQLNNYELHGVHLNVDYQNFTARGNGQSGRPGSKGGPRATYRKDLATTRGDVRKPSYPLRILVPGPVVGAIIGRKGETIRNITQNCKARVDVHGKENSGLIEKVITIFGQPENCSSACKEILKVVETESSASAVPLPGVGKNGAVALRMLAEERYCGRIIGKEGRFIKKVRDDTDTKISVANPQDTAHLFPETVITIRGSNIDNIIKAQAAISSRLVECIEREAAQQQQLLPPHAMVPPPIGYPPHMYGGGPAGLGMPPAVAGAPHHGGSSGPEAVMITVPNSAVGAIIGAGGSIIKQLMQDTGARISVEGKSGQDTDNTERTVVIRGNSDACWKASYYIFEKMKQEGVEAFPADLPIPQGAHHLLQGSYGDSVRLKTAIRIPRSTVGRVIGKNGKNIREIQRLTGTYIKLPEEQSQQGEEVLVEAYGTFMSTQGALNRIRALVAETQRVGGGAYDPESRPPRAPRVVGTGPRRPPQPIEAH